LDIGYRRTTTAGGFGWAASVANGYVGASQVVAEAVDLSSGDISKTRQLRHTYLPTANLEAGHRFGSGPEWFVRLSYGRELNLGFADSAFFALETGVRLHFRAKHAGAP
jgi:hypothetical protein